MGLETTMDEKKLKTAINDMMKYFVDKEISPIEAMYLLASVQMYIIKLSFEMLNDTK